MDKLVAEARTAALQGTEGPADRVADRALPEAWGDATMVRQALLNLLSNAVKYTGQRSNAEISVEGSENDDGNRLHASATTALAST